MVPFGTTGKLSKIDLPIVHPGGSRKSLIANPPRNNAKQEALRLDVRGGGKLTRERRNENNSPPAKDTYRFHQESGVSQLSHAGRRENEKALRTGGRWAVDSSHRLDAWNLPKHGTQVFYLRAPEVPKPAPRSKRPSKLDPYKKFIIKRWSEEVTNCKVLLRELQA